MTKVVWSSPEGEVMTAEELEAALLRVRTVLQHLKAIDQTTLTETERYALSDSLDQAYERAAFYLAESQKEPSLSLKRA